MSIVKSSRVGAILITFKIATLALSFFTNILFARTLGTEIYGQFAYVTSFAALFTPFAIMGLNNIVSKYFVRYPKFTHHHFVASLKIRLLGAIIAFVTGSLIAFSITDKNQAIAITVLLFGQICIAFYVIEFYFLSKHQAFLSNLTQFGALLISNIIKITAITMGANLLTLAAIQALEPILIALGYLFIYIKSSSDRKIKPHKIQQTCYRLVQQSKWLFLSGFAAVIYLKIDMVMLGYFTNPEEVAIYAAAAKLSEFWYLFPVLIANAFTTHFIQLRYNDENHYNQAIVQGLSLFAFAAIIIIIATYFAAHPLIYWLYGEAFSASAAVLSIHIFASIFVFQRAIFSKWIILEKLFHFSLITQAAGAISNILLNLYLIPRYGAIGAAWATLISYFIAGYASLLFNHKTRVFIRLIHASLLNLLSNIITLFKTQDSRA
ncbi:flippase [Pseudoalteromonas tunicata]|uniref:flippase n=1 Tax=Pseudoalteromonas tunicata TaxID=314281 RepID=UPI00273FAE11|nr:flippase [Pseudoalteromonas tunicata]MDP5213579.1 flippase [Pseudoalteromonas tunicata]